MSWKVFQRKEYSIYRAGDGFIIHNSNGEFEKHHTHIRSFKKAKSIVDLCIRKKLPDKPNIWEIESLIRIVKDKVYKDRLRSLLEAIK